MTASCKGGGEPPPPPKPQAHATWNGIPVYLNGGTAAQWTALTATGGTLTIMWNGLNITERGKFTNAVKRIDIGSGNTVNCVGTLFTIGGTATMTQVLPVLDPIIALLPPPHALRLAGLKTDLCDLRVFA